MGEAQKVNPFAEVASRAVKADTSPKPIRVLVDKLRLAVYAPTTVEAFADTVAGVRSSRVGKSRRGDPRAQAWTKPPKHEGGVYYQCDKPGVLTGNSCLCIAEFNPQKLDDEGLEQLATTFRAWGVQDAKTLFVDRYDAAFDYIMPRHHAMLDDPGRLLDMYGIGRRGPQTERTGYRSGSKLRAQIYDKTAERSGSGEKVVKDLTRF
ncbi:MAG: hypothetical protein WBA74_25500, partial [Cyclobacteriaceae bacterium]